jgi:hypothetical protein
MEQRNTVKRERCKEFFSFGLSAGRENKKQKSPDTQNFMARGKFTIIFLAHLAWHFFCVVPAE